MWSKDEAVGTFQLGKASHTLEQEIKRVRGTHNVQIAMAKQEGTKVETGSFNQASKH